MRTSIVDAALVILMLSACDRKANEMKPTNAAPQLPYRSATAAEVFELRSRCVALGEKLLDDDIHGAALSVDMRSNYNAHTNRCFIELDATKMDDPAHFHHETLFDGQTKEILAFTEDEDGKRRAAVFAKNDQPYDAQTGWYERAADYITNQMEDDRTS